MKSPTDAFFIFPPGLGNHGCFLPHLGVAYLQASLAQTSVRTQQFTSESSTRVADILELILASRPKVVGLTVYDSNYGVCLNIANHLKAIKPETWVIFGGPTATFAHDYILKRHQAVDLCVRGESEEIGPRLFAELLNTVPGCMEKLEGIPGLAFRRDGEIYSSGLTPLVGITSPGAKRLDSIPSPYLTGVLKDGRAGIITGRGCTHNCVYCSFAAMAQGKLRLHSIDHVLAELEAIKDYMRLSGRRFYVTLHDDAFTLIPTRAKELCERIASKELGLRLSCITRADAIDLDLLQLMKKAGFYGVAFGLESAVPSVLRAIGKVRPPQWRNPDLTPEKEFIHRVRQSVIWSKEMGFVTGVSIILGLPTETPDDARQTMQFVNNLPVDYYMHNILSVFPGTPLWGCHHDSGIETGLDPLGLPSTSKLPFNVFTVRAAAKSNREFDAKLIRNLATSALYGCGATVPKKGGITVAVIRADRMEKATADWLAGNLAVGGLVVQIYSQAEMATQRKLLREDRETLYLALTPLRYFLQMIPVADDGNCRKWLILSEISDVFEFNNPEAVTIVEYFSGDPLGSWALAEPRTEDLCWLESSLANQERFTATIKNLKEIGLRRLAREFPVPLVPAYPDRWMGGRPGCLGLSRIEVDSGSRIRVCQHGPEIGNLGEDLATISSRLETSKTQAVQRRIGLMLGNNGIPECPFPALPEETYCRLINAGHGEILKGLTTLSRLKDIMANLQDEMAIQL